MKTCGQCISNGIPKTPTGRNKQKVGGHCLRAKEVIDKFERKAGVYPFVGSIRLQTHAVWPDTPAPQCPFYEPVK